MKLRFQKTQEREKNKEGEEINQINQRKLIKFKENNKK